MVLTPMVHVSGLLNCLATLKSQGAVVLPPRYSPASFWQDLVEHNVTWYGTTPAMHRLILQLPHPKATPPSPRFIKSNSSPLPPALFHELESRLQIPVLDSYGLTETASFCTSNPLPPGARKVSSAGYAQGPQVSIRDQAGASLAAGLQGEICLRGENIMDGYRDDPNANARAFTSARATLGIWIPMAISSSRAARGNSSTREARRSVPSSWIISSRSIRPWRRRPRSPCSTISMDRTLAWRWF